MWEFKQRFQYRRYKTMDNQVLEVIRKRSSARAYSDEEVTKEQLEKIIEAGLQGLSLIHI